MRSILVVACVLNLTYWFGARPVVGQPQSGHELELELRADDQSAPACLTVDALRARIAHYSSASSSLRGLRLVLYITGPDAAELQIMRGSELVSRRRFEQLPSTCVDRRDAVALSIALALERTAASESERAPAAPTKRVMQTPEASAASASSASSASDATLPAATQPADQPKPEPASAQVVPVTPLVVGSQPEPTADAPIVLGTMPTTTSHDPRRKGTSPLQLHLGGRLTLEAVPVPVWVGALGLELPLAQSATLDITALVSSVGCVSMRGSLM